MKDQEVLFINTPGVQNLSTTFEKVGQETEILGIIIANKPGDYVVNVSAKHLVGSTSGRIIIRGISANGARVTVKGLIKIQPKAQEVSDFLEMKLLVLDKISQAIAQPELEIEANSVKASHAATVGQIDYEQMFYLMSRGISEKEAKNVVIRGFLNEVIKKIKDSKTQQKLLEMVE